MCKYFKYILPNHKTDSEGSVQFSHSVMTPWTTARQGSLSITNSRSLPKLTSIESVMPSNHLILCRSLLLLSSLFPSIRVFSNGLALHIRGQTPKAKVESHSLQTESTNTRGTPPCDQMFWPLDQEKGAWDISCRGPLLKGQET